MRKYKIFLVDKDKEKDITDSLDEIKAQQNVIRLRAIGLKAFYSVIQTEEKQVIKVTGKTGQLGLL